MIQPVLEHPTDESLTAYALGEGNGDIEAHVSSCPSCSRQVKEIREIGNALASLPDEEVPRNVRDKVMGAARAKRWGMEWFSLSCTKLLRSPLVLVIGIILAAIFLYIYFVFVL